MQKATKILKICLKKIANKQFYEWICRTHIDSMELFQLSQCHKLRWIRRKDDTIFQIFYLILRKNFIENLIDVFVVALSPVIAPCLIVLMTICEQYEEKGKGKGNRKWPIVFTFKVIRIYKYELRVQNIITKVRVYFCCTRVCSIHSDAIQYLQLNSGI